MWQHFDNDITEIPQSAARDDIEKRLKNISLIVIIASRKVRKNCVETDKANRIRDLKGDLKALGKRYKRANVEECQ